MKKKVFFRLKQFVQVFSVAALVFVLASAGFVAAQGTNNGIHGAFNGSVYVSSAYSLIFGDNTGSDVSLSKGAANTISLGPVGAHFGFTAANKDAVGVCTLGTNCAVTFVNAYVSAPVCVGTDQTAANAVKAAPTTTGVTFTGTGTDVIAYQCDGNPN